MNISAYLKVKLDTDRKIADSLDKGVKSAPGVTRQTLSDIYHGVERASWYSSCAFDNYQYICKDLKKEDVRMVLAVVEPYKRKDVIYDILVAYVKYVLKNESNKSNERKLAREGADIASTVLTEKATKLATSYAIAKSISEALNTSMAVRTAIGSWSSGVLTILQYYGKNQKAAMASRRLRMLEPGYYHILHAMKVEMLYIFIEPILSKIIKNINSLKNPTYEDIINILEGGE